MAGKELRMILSANIKQYRSHRSWSQADLAEKAGISITFLSNIERGNKWPYPDTLSNLADALEIEVFKLFIPKEPLSGAARDAISKLSKDLSITVNHSMETVFKQYLQEID
jgi:transcriptional regulator with XRE-family HTH domain